MSTTLQLDTNALMSLFPEGSEFRLQLRNVVVAEVTKRTFAKSTAMPYDIAEAFTKAAKNYVGQMEQAMTAALQSHTVTLMKDSNIGTFTKPEHWSRSLPEFKLSQEMKDRINAEVRHQFATTYKEVIAEQLPAMLEKYIKPEMFTEYIDKRMKALLDSEVGKRVAALLEVGK
jgi:hypothetical protein